MMFMKKHFDKAEKAHAKAQSSAETQSLWKLIEEYASWKSSLDLANEVAFGLAVTQAEEGYAKSRSEIREFLGLPKED